MPQVRVHLYRARPRPKHTLLSVQAMAEDLGDQDKAKQIQDQLNELEERAEALDRQRTKNISAIRCGTEPVLIELLPLAHGPRHGCRRACGLVQALHWVHIAPGSGLRASLLLHSPLTHSSYSPPVTSTSGTGSGTLWSLRRPWW